MKTPAWKAPVAKRHFSVAELAGKAQVSAEYVRAEIDAGALVCTDAKRQWVATEAGLKWLEKVRAQGGEPPAPPPEPEPTHEEIAENAAMSELLSPQQIEALLSLNLPDKVIKNAAAIERLSKTLIAVTQQNERALKVQVEAGRMVDMKDIEVFLDRVFADWIAEIRSLDSALEYRIAGEEKLPVEQVRRVLNAASNHLIIAGTAIADTTDARMDEFRREQADRAKRRVDGARRAAAH